MGKKQENTKFSKRQRFYYDTLNLAKSLDQLFLGGSFAQIFRRRLLFTGVTSYTFFLLFTGVTGIFFLLLSVNYCGRHNFLTKLILIKLKILYRCKYGNALCFILEYFFILQNNQLLDLFLVTCFFCVFWRSCKYFGI